MMPQGVKGKPGKEVSSGTDGLVGWIKRRRGASLDDQLLSRDCFASGDTLQFANDAVELINDPVASC